AGAIVYAHGDRDAGRRAIAKGLAEGGYSTLSPHIALDGVVALLARGERADMDAAKVVFERDYFTNTWDHDRRKIIEAFGEREALVQRFYKKMLEVEGTKLGGTTYSEPVKHRF